MDETLIDLLRADLEDANYCTDAVLTLLGSDADSARQRGVLEPARIALNARLDHPLSILIRVFLLAEAVALSQLHRALPRLRGEGALALGLVSQQSTGEVRAALSLNPVQLPLLEPGARDVRLISDLDDHLRVGSARPDHVMGVGGATRSLLSYVPWDRDHSLPGVGEAADLGTGCGVVAIWLALGGARRIVASDISARALTFARANARLNQIDPGRIDFRHGDLFEAFAGERFDLILSNPPFVITPRNSAEMPHYAYRDGGSTGDAIAQAVVQGAPAHLRPRGSLICLANWESSPESSGLERVRSWIERATEHLDPLAAWVIEREQLHPIRYAEVWARDGGVLRGTSEFDGLVRAWLEDFADRGVASIGLGAIRIERCESPGGSDLRPVIRTEHASGQFSSEPGAALKRAFDAGVRAERMTDEEILRAHWLLNDHVSEVRNHRPGEESPHTITLTAEEPMTRAVVADTMLAAAVGACDGDLTLGQISEALASLLEMDSKAVATALVASVRELTWLGMLAAAYD